ncbi:MAG: DUF4340 domain-containing protein [Phycisphaerales bacterium]|nr:DUF4340 domain-containing protein [Phycisphaerales bacterium]
MRWSTVCIVWVMGIAAAGAAWIWSAPSDGDRETTSGTAMAELAATLDDITHIELDHDGHHWVFDREADGWWQTAPFRHRVRGELLASMPATAVHLEVLDAMDANAADLPELAAIGLDPPFARVMLQAGPDQPSRQLNLGRRGMAGRAWASRPAKGQSPSQVLVVDGALHELLEQEPPESWRDLRLFPELSVNADKIERTVSGETLTLEREGRRWRITSPLPTRADDAFVMQHISELASTRAETVMLDQPASLDAFGLNPPIARVSVYERGTLHTVLVGDRVGGASQNRYALIEGVPSVLQIAAKDVSLMLGDPSTLVDHTGTDVTTPDVSGIRIVTMNDDLLIERTLDEWYSPDRGEAIATRIEQLLGVLTATRGAEVILHETYPEDLEVAVVTLLDAAGGPLDTVRILRELRPPAGQGRWALENGDRVLRVMAPDTEIPLGAADFGLASE